MDEISINKKHFAFDLDDTLTDSYDFNQQMFVDTFAEYINISDPDNERYLRHLHFDSRGVSMQVQFDTAIKRFSLQLDPSDLVKKNEEMHIKKIEGIKLFDAVEEFIKEVKGKGKKVSLFSNRQSTSLMKLLEKHELVNYFDNIISCGDAGHNKPDPFCMEELISHSGEPKENFIYFGDSKTDSEFAKNAGIDCIIVDHYLNQKKFYKLILQLFK